MKDNKKEERRWDLFIYDELDFGMRRKAGS